MLHPSTKKLIDRLAEMTGQKRIDWLAGDRDDTLVFDTEGYRVLLQGDPATLRLTDALGRELESASPDELAATPHDGGGTYGATMAALRREAQRIARGTEGAISAVLGGLDAEPVGKTPVFEADGLAPSESEMVEPGADMLEDAADEAHAAPDMMADEADVPEAASDPEPAAYSPEPVAGSEPESAPEDSNIAGEPAGFETDHDEPDYEELDVGRAVEDMVRHVNGDRPADEPLRAISGDTDDNESEDERWTASEDAAASMDGPAPAMAETLPLAVAASPADTLSGQPREPSRTEPPALPPAPSAPAIHAGFGGSGGFSDLSRYRPEASAASTQSGSGEVPPLSPLPASAHRASETSSDVLSLSGLGGLGLNPVEPDRTPAPADTPASLSPKADEGTTGMAVPEPARETPPASPPQPADAGVPDSAPLPAAPAKPDEPAARPAPKPASSRFNPWM